MKTIFQKTLNSVLALAGLVFASSADATVISYTVDGVAPQQLASSVTPPADAPWGVNGYPGDTVALQSYTGTFDLTVGTTVQKINSLLWTVNYTYGGTATDPNAWSDVLSNINATRQIQIGTSTATLSQLGTLDAAWDNDYLGFSGGSTATLSYQGYQIDITPLAVESAGATNFDGDNPWAQPSQDIYAQFVVSAAPSMANAPEPGSIAALLGLVALSGGSSVASRLRFKKAR
ncbi:MAG: hypothetical protein WCH57_09690 [Verrucomicrobiota bacterium]